MKLKKLLATSVATLAVCGLSMPAFAAENSASTLDTYTIQKDDTFWSISQKEHIPLSTLMRENAKFDPLNLPIGGKLQLPNNQAQKPSSEHRTVVEATSAMNAVASAYSAHPSENGWGPVDYLGNPLKLGTIAVDPAVIPLGSKVKISGIHYPGLPSQMIAYATDQGSDIKGNRIDIFIPGTKTAVNQFGFQNVTVQILE